MNPLIAGALVGALLLPVPPVAPRTTQRVPAGPSSLQPDRSTASWPLEPRPEVVAGFVPPAGEWAAGHRGVDLLSAAGAEVEAALAGTVGFAGTVAGRGVVVLDHGTYETTYEPVEATVRRGEQVGTGEVIGTLQSALSHCAPRVCLHWGLVENGVYRDPLTLLERAQVRLLPLEDQARG
jgi:murein DD-endopeptidase MepM/ murein hydrolase activator NlpD